MDMKRINSVLVQLFLAVTALAQIPGGSVTGTAKDEQGGVVPGVMVSVQGVDATRTIISDETGEFRFYNLPPGPYKLTLSLQGFTTTVRENVIVEVGRNVDLQMVMKVAGVSETVSVTEASPIVDTKQVGTATNFTATELQSIPTSRDPWALMRVVPGVLVDRANIGGNESGQQSNIVSKATRPQDTVWTMDGVVITDMAATGASPSYYNYDNFEEIQVATSGQDIKQPTGGMGLNLIIKRGTNQFHGQARGYFDNESMESNNVPSELAATGVTHATTDHNKQISDYGAEIGGPIWKDHAWFYGSYSIQDIRLVRRAGALIDRTQLKNPTVKLNWQATPKDMISFLYFDGFKIKNGRSPGTAGILYDAVTATYHQDNAYTDFPLHGLWKIADDHVFGPKMMVSARFAYYNTGFILDPIGGLDMQAGRSFTTGQSFGSINQRYFTRPQKTASIDADSFFSGMGASHDLKYGWGFRRADSTNRNLYPGNMILAIENSPTDFQARVYREGFGANRTSYLDFYAGDTITRGRMTITAGIRYDHQWGKALPSTTRENKAFPNLVPGLVFAGYDAPFKWNNVSPRVGITYALDQSRKTLMRASYARYAAQLDNDDTVGFLNPSSNAGYATYRWVPRAGDHFVHPDEVLTDQLINAADGFNPANPTAAASPNQIDPNLKAPITQSFVIGADRELAPNLMVQVNYSYTRTSRLFGNPSNNNPAPNITPRVGVRPGPNGDYLSGAGFSGSLPNGQPYNVPTFIPDPAKVAAGGNGFRVQNIPGYYTDYQGLELDVVKRLSKKFMTHVGFAWNSAHEHFSSKDGMYDSSGNPTPTDTEPLINGGQFVRRSGGSGSGTIYVNANWQLNASGLYQAPYGIEISANMFGRQGYPFPLYRQGTTATLGADSSLKVLVSPAMDYLRYPTLWNTDFRASRQFKIAERVTIRGIIDVFNVFNANTALVRNNNIGATTFNALAQNLSPRIARGGLIIGF
jgi:hypothetical protein